MTKSERALVMALQGLGAASRVPDALRFEAAARRPEEAQSERLRAILAECRDTAFGRTYGLSEIKSFRDLQRRVPIQNYADVEPWIVRQMKGEPSVLTTEPPVLFASSTGTTGTPKRVPITPTHRRDFQRTVAISLSHLATRFPRAFTGTAVYFVGRARIDAAPCGTPIGYPSGFNQSTLPSFVQRVLAWPYALCEVGDGYARQYLAAWLAARSPVTFCAGIFPIALLELFRAAEGFAEPLVRDFRRGTLRDDLALTPEERAVFERFATVDLAAADRIETEARGAGGALPARALFPKLKMVYCWTTSSAANFLPELQQRLGEGTVIRDAIYAANEAWANVTFGEESPGGPVSVTSHVLEFIEETAWARGVREGQLAHDLESGRFYRVIATTSAGLFRYDLGDIVECTGRYHEIGRVQFARRAGAQFSITGDKLHEGHVMRAVAALSRRTGVRFVFFAAVPRFNPTPRWELALEIDGNPSADSLSQLRSDLDEELRRENEDYNYQRRGALRPLALRILEPGESGRRWREAVASGKPEAQMKTVHLMSDPSALAEWRVARLVEAS